MGVGVGGWVVQAETNTAKVSRLARSKFTGEDGLCQQRIMREYGCRTEVDVAGSGSGAEFVSVYHLVDDEKINHAAKFVNPPGQCLM